MDWKLWCRFCGNTETIINGAEPQVDEMITKLFVSGKLN